MRRCSVSTDNPACNAGDGFGFIM